MVKKIIFYGNRLSATKLTQANYGNRHGDVLTLFLYYHYEISSRNLARTARASSSTLTKPNNQSTNCLIPRTTGIDAKDLIQHHN